MSQPGEPKKGRDKGGEATSSPEAATSLGEHCCVQRHVDPPRVGLTVYCLRVLDTEGHKAMKMCGARVVL